MKKFLKKAHETTNLDILTLAKLLKISKIFFKPYASANFVSNTHEKNTFITSLALCSEILFKINDFSKEKDCFVLPLIQLNLQCIAISLGAINNLTVGHIVDTISTNITLFLKSLSENFIESTTSAMVFQSYAILKNQIMLFNAQSVCSAAAAVIFPILCRKLIAIYNEHAKTQKLPLFENDAFLSIQEGDKELKIEKNAILFYPLWHFELISESKIERDKEKKQCEALFLNEQKEAVSTKLLKSKLAELGGLSQTNTTSENKYNLKKTLLSFSSYESQFQKKLYLESYTGFISLIEELKSYSSKLPLLYYLPVILQVVCFTRLGQILEIKAVGTEDLQLFTHTIVAYQNAINFMDSLAEGFDIVDPEDDNEATFNCEYYSEIILRELILWGKIWACFAIERVDSHRNRLMISKASTLLSSFESDLCREPEAPISSLDLDSNNTTKTMPGLGEEKQSSSSHEEKIDLIQLIGSKYGIVTWTELDADLELYRKPFEQITLESFKARKSCSSMSALMLEQHLSELFLACDELLLQISSTSQNKINSSQYFATIFLFNFFLRFYPKISSEKIKKVILKIENLFHPLLEKKLLTKEFFRLLINMLNPDRNNWDKSSKDQIGNFFDKFSLLMNSPGNFNENSLLELSLEVNIDPFPHLGLKYSLEEKAAYQLELKDLLHKKPKRIDNKKSASLKVYVKLTAEEDCRFNYATDMFARLEYDFRMNEIYMKLRNWKTAKEVINNHNQSLSKLKILATAKPSIKKPHLPFENFYIENIKHKVLYLSILIRLNICLQEELYECSQKKMPVGKLKPLQKKICMEIAEINDLHYSYCEFISQQCREANFASQAKEYLVEFNRWHSYVGTCWSLRCQEFNEELNDWFLQQGKTSTPDNKKEISSDWIIESNNQVSLKNKTSKKNNKNNKNNKNIRKKNQSNRWEFTPDISPSIYQTTETKIASPELKLTSSDNVKIFNKPIAKKDDYSKEDSKETSNITSNKDVKKLSSVKKTIQPKEKNLQANKTATITKVNITSFTPTTHTVQSQPKTSSNIVIKEKSASTVNGQSKTSSSVIVNKSQNPRDGSLCDPHQTSHTVLYPHTKKFSGNRSKNIYRKKSSNITTSKFPNRNSLFSETKIDSKNKETYASVFKKNLRSETRNVSLYSGENKLITSQQGLSTLSTRSNTESVLTTTMFTHPEAIQTSTILVPCSNTSVEFNPDLFSVFSNDDQGEISPEESSSVTNPGSEDNNSSTPSDEKTTLPTAIDKLIQIQTQGKWLELERFELDQQDLLFLQTTSDPYKVLSDFATNENIRQPYVKGGISRQLADKYFSEERILDPITPRDVDLEMPMPTDEYKEIALWKLLTDTLNATPEKRHNLFTLRSHINTDIELTMPGKPSLVNFLVCSLRMSLLFNNDYLIGVKIYFNTVYFPHGEEEVKQHFRDGFLVTPIDPALHFQGKNFMLLPQAVRLHVHEKWKLDKIFAAMKSEGHTLNYLKFQNLLMAYKFHSCINNEFEKLNDLPKEETMSAIELYNKLGWLPYLFPHLKIDSAQIMIHICQTLTDCPQLNFNLLYRLSYAGCWPLGHQFRISYLIIIDPALFSSDIHYVLQSYKISHDAKLLRPKNFASLAQKCPMNKVTGNPKQQQQRWRLLEENLGNILLTGTAAENFCELNQYAIIGKIFPNAAANLNSKPNYLTFLQDRLDDTDSLIPAERSIKSIWIYLLIGEILDCALNLKSIHQKISSNRFEKEDLINEFTTATSEDYRYLFNQMRTADFAQMTICALTLKTKQNKPRSVINPSLNLSPIESMIPIDPDAKRKYPSPPDLRQMQSVYIPTPSNFSSTSLAFDPRVAIPYTHTPFFSIAETLPMTMQNFPQSSPPRRPLQRHKDRLYGSFQFAADSRSRVHLQTNHAQTFSEGTRVSTLSPGKREELF